MFKEGEPIKIPEEFKAKFIAALRSGDYKQASGFLYDEVKDGYCCLGVAATLCGIPKAELAGKTLFSSGCYNITNEDTFLPSVPSEIPDWLIGNMNRNYSGMKSDLFNPLVQDLADKNDRGDSFDIIASYIQETY